MLGPQVLPSIATPLQPRPRSSQLHEWRADYSHPPNIFREQCPKRMLLDVSESIMSQVAVPNSLYLIVYSLCPRSSRCLYLFICDCYLYIREWNRYNAIEQQETLKQSAMLSGRERRLEILVLRRHSASPQTSHHILCQSNRQDPALLCPALPITSLR